MEVDQVKLSNDINSIFADDPEFRDTVIRNLFPDNPNPWVHEVTPESIPVLHDALKKAQEILGLKEPLRVILFDGKHSKDAFAQPGCIFLGVNALKDLSEEAAKFATAHEVAESKLSRRAALAIMAAGSAGIAGGYLSAEALMKKDERANRTGYHLLSITSGLVYAMLLVLATIRQKEFLCDEMALTVFPDPKGVEDFFAAFRNLDQADPGALQKLLSTHPTDARRVKNAKRFLESKNRSENER